MAEQPESKSKSVSDRLAAKLEKRPNPQQVGYNKNLSPTLASVVKKLETEQKKDIVDKILKNRPAPTEAGVDTTIAPSIQPTVKTLTNKIRRDSLKQSLQARPDVQELIDSGVLKPFSQTLANSLQVDAAKLESALASQVSKEYLKEIGILDPYKKNVDDTKIDIEKSSGLLLRALVYRKSSNSILKEGGRGSGTQFGFINNIDPCIQDKAKHLDIQQKKDKLSAALQNRPSPRGVMNKQVEQLGYDISVAPTLQQTIKNLGKEMIKDTLNTLFKNNIKEKKNRNRKRASSIESFDVEKLAPTLQNIANKLAMEQKKNTLSAQLNSRPDAQELIDGRILKPYAYSLANRLQLNADILEKQLAMRVDENYLKSIGILEPYKKNVDDTKIDIEQASNLILKSLIIKQKERREIAEIAPSLQATAKKLEHEKTKDLLKKKLERNRPNRKDIFDIDDSVANSLQATKKKLEKEMVKDTINKTLSTRQEPEMIKEIKDTKISPAIQSIAISLQSKMRRQSISEKLQARPDMQELIDTGILKPYSINLAKSLQVDANQLEQALAQRVSKEYLKEIGILDPYKKNVDDTKIDIEKSSGLLLRALLNYKKPLHQDSIKQSIKQQTTAFGFNNDIAPTLQQTAKHLDVQQKKDKLSAALENRPTPRGLMRKQVGELGYDISVAPTLQQTIKNLGREMLKDLLEKALRERPDAKHVGHGVDIKNAPAIQGAMHDLQSAQRRDSVSKGIRDRKSVKEVGVDTQLARGLQSIAKTLEMEMKTDTVKHKLRNLGIIKKNNTESVLVKIDQCVQFLANYKF